MQEGETNPLLPGPSAPACPAPTDLLASCHHLQNRQKGRGGLEKRPEKQVVDPVRCACARLHTDTQTHTCSSVAYRRVGVSWRGNISSLGVYVWPLPVHVVRVKGPDLRRCEMQRGCRIREWKKGEGGDGGCESSAPREAAGITTTRAGRSTSSNHLLPPKPPKTSMVLPIIVDEWPVEGHRINVSRRGGDDLCGEIENKHQRNLSPRLSCGGCGAHSFSDRERTWKRLCTKRMGRLCSHRFPCLRCYPSRLHHRAMSWGSSPRAMARQTALRQDQALNPWVKLPWYRLLTQLRPSILAFASHSSPADLQLPYWLAPFACCTPRAVVNSERFPALQIHHSPCIPKHVLIGTNAFRAIDRRVRCFRGRGMCSVGGGADKFRPLFFLEGLIDSTPRHCFARRHDVVRRDASCCISLAGGRHWMDREQHVDELQPTGKSNISSSRSVQPMAGR